jgi:hypothetical protein
MQGKNMNSKTISMILGLDKTAAKKKALPAKLEEPEGGGGAEGRIETIKGESKPLPLMPPVNTEAKTAMEIAIGWRMDKQALSSLPEDISVLWSQLTDDQKMAVIGGGVGAVGGGTYGALTGDDRKEKIKRALMFGGAGAAVGAGAGYFGNQAVNAINPGTSSGPIGKGDVPPIPIGKAPPGYTPRFRPDLQPQFDGNAIAEQSAGQAKLGDYLAQALAGFRDTANGVPETLKEIGQEINDKPASMLQGMGNGIGGAANDFLSNGPDQAMGMTNDALRRLTGGGVTLEGLR